MLIKQLPSFYLLITLKRMISDNNINNKKYLSISTQEVNSSTVEPISNNTELKNIKDEVLRIKCESAFDSLAISKREFYQRAKISPQYWWRLSYRYDEFPMWLKKHLFREFGDCFAFLFSDELKEEENKDGND